jgi:hypothetical protein
MFCTKNFFIFPLDYSRNLIYNHREESGGGSIDHIHIHRRPGSRDPPAPFRPRSRRQPTVERRGVCPPRNNSSSSSRNDSESDSFCNSRSRGRLLGLLDRQGARYGPPGVSSPTELLQAEAAFARKPMTRAGTRLAGAPPRASGLAEAHAPITPRAKDGFRALPPSLTLEAGPSADLGRAGGIGACSGPGQPEGP